MRKKGTQTRCIVIRNQMISWKSFPKWLKENLLILAQISSVKGEIFSSKHKRDFSNINVEENDFGFYNSNSNSLPIFFLNCHVFVCCICVKAMIFQLKIRVL